MSKSITKITAQIRWRLMSDRERYAQLWRGPGPIGIQFRY